MFEKKPANWTEVHSVVSNNGVKRSFYFSDKGALKITRHTDKGEQIVSIMPGSVLSDLEEIFPCELVGKLKALHEDAKADFTKAKELTKIQNQAARKIQRAMLTVQATREELLRQGFPVDQVNAMLGIKSA